MFLLFLFFLLGTLQADSLPPACHYECSDPVFYAVCHPVCDPAVCQVCHNDTGTPDCEPVQEGACTVQCPGPLLYSNESCPECETACSGSLCHPYDTECQVLCEESVCAWACTLPPSYLRPEPICIPQCEEPTCAFSSPAHRNGLGLSGILLFSLTLILSQ